MSGNRCEDCGAGNSARARFCMACGRALAHGCARCGASAEPGARFCIECGAPLDAPAAASDLEPTPSTAEERRTVTILFADIVGYTTVAERLDHETVKALTDCYLTRLAREVERFGGYVDQYIGDNVMAVFGAPTAHEDDPERAIRAAHGMQGAMAELNQTVAPDFGLTLALRVGVNTGEVLAGRIGTEYTVVGDAVNVAARLQAAAAVGRILVGDRTRRSTATTVEYRQIGPLILKGKTDPVNAWEVVSLADRRPSRAPAVPRTPLIGREAELGRLLDLCERATRERLPQLAAVIGEAGVGKTRLLAELEQRLKRRVPRMRVLPGRTAGFGASSAFEPLAEMLRDQLGILRESSEAEISGRVHERLGPIVGGEAGGDLRAARLAPFVQMLGGNAPSAEASIDPGDQQSAREDFFAILRGWIETLAADSVPILVWEDIQWADEGTLELIDYLDEWVQAPLLQICVGREELLERLARGAPPRRPAARVMLAPLANDHARQLVAALLGGDGDPARTQQLALRCGGNPLFAEALVDRIAEAGEQDAGPLPDTVQSLLAARLDALPQLERRLLGDASVVGVDFTRSTLEYLAGGGVADLDGALSRLCERNLIAERDPVEPEDSAYSFRHMLIREVIYGMLPKAVRARRHTEVGELLEGRQEGGGAHRGALAEHFTRAASLAAEVHLSFAEVKRMRHRALRHGIAAGDGAAALFANREALTRYRTASEFADDADPVLLEITEKRGEVESRLGHLDAAIEAWQSCIESHSAAGRHERSAEMHRKVAAALVHSGERDAAVKHLQSGIDLVRDRPPSLAVARLFGEAATLYLQVGANMLAAYAAERALSYAGELADVRAASRAYGIQGRVFGRTGDFVKARECLARAVDVVRESDPQEAIIALSAAGRNLGGSEGDYAAAGERYGEALATAERIGEVPAQVELKAALAHLALYACDWGAAARDTELSAQLAEQEGLVSKLCMADALRGRLCWHEGDWEASEQLLRRAHEAAAQNAWSDLAAQAMLWLSDTQADRDDRVGADATLRQALALSERTALSSQAAEVCAALARLHAGAGHEDLAEDVVRRAARLAERGRDPVTAAAASEARGALDGAEGLDLLAAAEQIWEQTGRPLESARCMALRAEGLRRRGDPAAEALNALAAERFEALRVPHLAARLRGLASERHIPL